MNLNGDIKFYPLELTLAAGVTVTDSDLFTVDAGYDYYIHSTQMLCYDGAGAVVENPLVTVMLNDGSRDFSASAVPAGAVFGTGQLPYVWPVIHRLSAGTTVTVTAYNLSAAVAANMRVLFAGVRVPAGRPYLRG